MNTLNTYKRLTKSPVIRTLLSAVAIGVIVSTSGCDGELFEYSFAGNVGSIKPPRVVNTTVQNLPTFIVDSVSLKPADSSAVVWLRIVPNVDSVLIMRSGYVAIHDSVRMLRTAYFREKADTILFRKYPNQHYRYNVTVDSLIRRKKYLLVVTEALTLQNRYEWPVTASAEIYLP